MLRLFALLFAFTFAFVVPVSADSTPQVKIQVFAMHLNRITKITLSSLNDGETYIELEPGSTYNPKDTPPPPIFLSGEKFVAPFENFLLEVDFETGTQVTVPLRLMRPIKDSVKQVRLAGRTINPSGYAGAIDRAIGLFSDRKAYEPFSLCSNYYHHAEGHPSFAISAAICWLKSNRLMVLATKPPFRRFFGADSEMLTEVKGIITKVESNKTWATAYGNSYYPDSSMEELKKDIRFIELSEWRLFVPRDIARLDGIYGSGTSCEALEYFASLASTLSDQDIDIITSASIGVKTSDLEDLMNTHVALDAKSDCVESESS